MIESKAEPDSEGLAEPGSVIKWVPLTVTTPWNWVSFFYPFLLEYSCFTMLC